MVTFNDLTNTIEIEMVGSAKVFSSYEVSSTIKRGYALFFGGHLRSRSNFDNAYDALSIGIRNNANIKLMYDGSLRSVYVCPTTIVADLLNNILFVY